MTNDEIFTKAAEAIVQCDENASERIAREAIALGVEPIEAINKGFAVGLRKIGDLFEDGEIFLPEVILASEAMLKAVKILEAHMPKEENVKLGTVVIGSIEGDIHDIGKGIVATMLRINGFEIYDLGRDVPIELFVQIAKKVNATLVASSSLMTTTMAGQKRLQEALVKAGLSVKTMVGGVVVSQYWADMIGALYAENAKEAVEKAIKFVKDQSLKT